jgi:hypothetical protein
MNDVFDEFHKDFTRPEEELALRYCNEATQNIDDDHVYDWAEERLNYNEVLRREGPNIDKLLTRFPKIDRVLFVSAITKVCGTYWLANGGTPPNSDNLAAKMDY